MLVSFSENVFVSVKLLPAGQHACHPGQASLEQPEELVDVVPGHIFFSSQDENCVVVFGSQSVDRVSVFARRHREIRIGIGENVGRFDQFVDDDEG